MVVNTVLESEKQSKLTELRKLVGRVWSYHQGKKKVKKPTMARTERQIIRVYDKLILLGETADWQNVIIKELKENEVKVWQAVNMAFNIHKNYRKMIFEDLGISIK